MGFHRGFNGISKVFIRIFHGDIMDFMGFHGMYS